MVLGQNQNHTFCVAAIALFAWQQCRGCVDVVHLSASANIFKNLLWAHRFFRSAVKSSHARSPEKAFVLDRRVWSLESQLGLFSVSSTVCQGSRNESGRFHYSVTGSLVKLCWKDLVETSKANQNMPEFADFFLASSSSADSVIFLTWTI